MYEAALVLSTLCFFALVIVFARTPAASVFHPLTYYLAFHGFIFVLRPIVAYLQDFRLVYLVYRFTPSISDKLTVILGSNLGLLAFAFFALRSGGAAMRFGQDQFAIAERNRMVSPALFCLAVVVPAGVVSLILGWQVKASDVTDLVMDRGTGAFLNTTSNGYLTDAQLMLATASAMVAWLFRFRLLSLAPLAAFVLFRAGTGGRGPFVSAMVCVGLLWLYERREKFPNLRTIMAGVFLVLAFNVVGADRGRAIRQFVGGDNSAEAESTYDLKFLEGMDYANLEYFEFLVYAVPQRTGSYDYFSDHLVLITGPIPRVMWPEKPAASPVSFFELFDYGYPIGMTRSLPGEGWVGLGWLGIILWCGLWGHTLGAIYNKFVTTGQNTFGVISYMMLLGILVVAYRDGTVITIARSGLFYFAPIVLWMWIANWVDIPRARDLRAAFNRKLRARVAGSTLDVVPTSVKPKTYSRGHVPPAVLRRRARLASGGPPNESQV